MEERGRVEGKRGERMRGKRKGMRGRCCVSGEGGAVILVRGIRGEGGREGVKREGSRVRYLGERGKKLRKKNGIRFRWQEGKGVGRRERVCEETRH